MRKLLRATLVVLALLALTATSALAADPEIVQPTVTVTMQLDGTKYCTVFDCGVSVEGLSVAIWGTNGTSVTVTGPELEAIWGTNGTSIITVTGPEIEVSRALLAGPIIATE